jgi:DNA modification methylase
MENMAPGTSIFDPVLAELAYRWFCPDGGSILDPFAGGSVRGIVASRLGHPYLGIDLSAAQLEANEVQAETIVREGDPYPQWVVGDSATVLPTLTAEAYDLIFTCPPYFDLEVYSDDPRDLSNMDWWAFVKAYETIIEEAALRLRRDRFAAIVVSEVRAPDGMYRGLIHRTITAFERAGMRFYNEAVLVNTAGSLPLRAARQFEATRKLGRTHQNVLVFLKGAIPRGWTHEREQLPDPQLALFTEEGPSDAPDAA